MQVKLALGYTYFNGVLISPAIAAQQAQRDLIQELSQSRRRRPVDRIPQQAQDAHALQDGLGQQAGPGQQDGLVRRFRCNASAATAIRTFWMPTSSLPDQWASVSRVQDKVAAGGDCELRKHIKHFLLPMLQSWMQGGYLQDQRQVKVLRLSAI